MTEKWHAWKQNPGPLTLRELYREHDGIIQHAVNNMAASGIPRLALEAEARKLAHKAFQTYDPSKAQLSTHVTNHLKNLNRYMDKHSQAIRLPEAKARASERVFKAVRELEAQLGRKPTAREVSEHTGIGEASIGGLMRFQTHLYSLNEGEETMGQPVREDIGHMEIVQEYLYHTLPPQHLTVFLHTTGFKDHPILPAGQIAKKLNVKPSRVSAIRKDIGKRIQDYMGAVDILTQ